jgi:2',3'-cyclic-nucleotide 2'-phosphodiesterase (5'-nucleotidase family)
VDVDVVLHGSLDDVALPPGDLNMAAIWRIVPYENRIGIVSLTPEEIDEILEENAAYQGQISHMGAYGLRYRLDLEAPPGERVSSIRLADGSAPHARGRLRVAFNSYVLASGGLRFNSVRRLVDRPEARLELTKIDTRNATARYVRKHSPLSAASLMAPEGLR